MFNKIYKTLIENKVVAVVRTNSYEEAKEISEGAILGGFKVIEITMSVPNATKLIGELKEKYNDLCIGAGTVLSKEEVDGCIENKVDFIVSPCFDEEIIEYCKEKKTLIIPGLMTMSEVNKARKLGLEFIKVFPGNVVGKAFVGAVKSIFPELKIMPTGGVNKENINEWFKVGADCTGIGSDLNKAYKVNGFDGVKNYCESVIEEIK
ncbi:bifunctional 4-hydroxy-2-oxoglutarate aldolase/2-dehydro-3-deoxy-phosphogluconate aldolase [Clostridium intestinale]|uniref:Bifunctional 4-hydroxy-2-oxoglutarate aldolase/2-dehydro-3-deoxy-phosphogluconate aldolase n=1 Tax=Clostridium intestinale TaxID=36845 RepID=A0A7D6ZRE1_9CLOT|nr:bifunctional 4-hydroxy-2-oxoglutarate aldolase/2-dehydro-3-deoxy-phosphogluconate aldolase [Clostridium intestinale]QLY80663.1 bifunctional 4-hydroxy-2-oxoglutarate aldolase/2-dehydro-3-deoxy-phosphogluconate aldolase [Clostridium intestinale]